MEPYRVGVGRAPEDRCALDVAHFIPRGKLDELLLFAGEVRDDCFESSVTYGETD